MKILFLHLSDFHIQSKDAINPLRIQSLADSLAILAPFSGCVIVVSGDIASSGEYNQYKLAGNFFGQLKNEITGRYSKINQNDYKLLIIPGNHDINYKGKKLPTKESIKSSLMDTSRDYYCEELSRMREFFSFSDKNQCFFSERYISLGQVSTRKILHFSSGYRIEANLINTAPYSCKDDNGLHFIPEEALTDLRRPSEADISIIAMHHSPSWFEYTQRKELEYIISQRCSLAFYGHEHFPETQTTSKDEDGIVIQQAGAAWWQEEATNDSGFYAATYDTECLSYTISKFTWDYHSLKYIPSEPIQQNIVPKPLNGKSMIYKDTFIKELLADEKHNISDSISDYFVFPKLHLDVSKEYTGNKNIGKMQDLIKLVLANKFVAITGDSNRGKTTLLKMLFNYLRTDFTTLYCGIDDISGKNQDRIIRTLVQNAFGESAYTDFLQKPKESRIIIIDDVHRISSRHLSKFLKGLENIFEYIIVAIEDDAKFDIVQMVKDNMQSSNEFVRLSIDKLYAAKRLEVIEKVVSIKNQSESLSNCEITRCLEQYINSYKLAFRTEIDFVVQFADYYCSHLGELEKSDATVFSKVFEASIERAIEPILRQRCENTSDVIVALSEVAHHIHFSREYPVSSEQISNVLSAYREYYDNTWLTSDRFFEIAEHSNLLIKTPDGFRYRFKSKDHLAYFVAKALNRKFHDDGVSDNLKTVVEQSGFGINSDILMFLTYIADNVAIPRLLLEQACFFTQDWEEYTLNSGSIKFLSGISDKKSLPPDASQKETQLVEQSDIEERQDTGIETLDIYDYDITQIDKLNYQLVRSFKQLSVISKCFSAFISILPSADKKSFAKSMYEMPNRIFNQWATSVDNNIEALISDIIEWQENDSSITKKADRDKILEFFQMMSIELLLNLYYEVSSQGANSITVDYLAKQKSVEVSTSHQIELLMFLEKVDDCKSLIKAAEALYDNTDDGMTKRMIVAIIRHMLINSDKISSSERRSVANKYFSPRGKTALLLDRQKALSEKSL